MASSKRRCATCRYFQDSGMSGNGWCTHPDRQVSSDVRILVRKAELACRNAWGSDLWVDANADDSEPSRSTHHSIPDQPVPTINVSYDDEVTSVVSTGEHGPTRLPLDDEVVEQSVISFEDDYDEEQDERRDLLYRDSRSAIERARQRHMQRHQPRPHDEDAIISEGAESQPRESGSQEQPVFEPDDFVEEETPGRAHGSDEGDDQLLSEGIRTPTPRSLRLRRFRDETPQQKKDLTTTRIEPDLDGVDLELPPSAAPERGRFDSVPEISAEVDLPLLRRSSSANDRHDAPGDSPEPTSPSYERALKRAHDINAAARLERDQERRRSTAPAPLRESPVYPSMPDLPDTLSTTGHEQPLPQGTSAILHPRPGAETVQEPADRARTGQRSHRSSSAPIQNDHSRTRPPEARKSWWRGSRQIEALETQAFASPVSGASEEWHSEPQLDSRAALVPPIHQDRDTSGTPEPVHVAGLQSVEDMDALRDRLFSAPAATQEDAVVAPRRTPISVARRVSRPEAQTPSSQRLSQPAPRREPISGGTERPAEPRRTSGPAPASPTRREVEPAVQGYEVPDGEPDTSLPERSRGGLKTPLEERHRVQPHASGKTHERDSLEQPTHQPRRSPSQAPVRPEPIAPETLLADPRDAWYEPEPVGGFDVRHLINKDSGLLDMTIEIAPDVPKACRTCRSFRPSEQEGRGWCINEWAFTHRQMVNETDLACDSTIGCWWLPTDRETWLEDFEVVADATPRVDRLLAHLQPERRAVGN